ncbi:RNA polymerase sigma-70 factor [uncultured Parabacteroides sp.]|uniref:RNA polymerase sigma-70 factor n=1 Tax=uncultured Parabacteroides sp. TaxID=512312 RepID=UPI0025ED7EBE|nr:RNA polymerase sigma-70 factor [uncultured Parabacteroides sp.]
MSSERYVQDFAALEALFKRFYKPLRAYAFRFVNDKDLSEDIVQDVFFELWQRRESIRFEDAAVKSYLFRAVYTHSLNALNKKLDNVYTLEPAREPDILDHYVTSYMQNSEQSLLLKELEDEIMSYINTLPPQCHKIFLLSRSYGLKNREIADQLGISIKAVEKQISKALYGLKEHLVKKDLFPLLVLAVTCLSH